MTARMECTSAVYSWKWVINPDFPRNQTDKLLTKGDLIFIITRTRKLMHRNHHEKLLLKEGLCKSIPRTCQRHSSDPYLKGSYWHYSLSTENTNFNHRLGQELREARCRKGIWINMATVVSIPVPLCWNGSCPSCCHTSAVAQDPAVQYWLKEEDTNDATAHNVSTLKLKLQLPLATLALHGKDSMRKKGVSTLAGILVLITTVQWGQHGGVWLDPWSGASFAPLWCNGILWRQKNCQKVNGDNLRT
jgi:hypothetical protein